MNEKYRQNYGKIQWKNEGHRGPLTSKERGDIFFEYTPLYRVKEALSESIMPEKCPECGHTEYRVGYTAPPSFACEACDCWWSEEEGIPVNGVVQAKLTIEKHGSTVAVPFSVTPCPKCEGKEKIFVVNEELCICGECKNTWPYPKEKKENGRY